VTEYTMALDRLIRELEHWASARDKINRKRLRDDDDADLLGSIPLREAASRLRDYQTHSILYSSYKQKESSHD